MRRKLAAAFKTALMLGTLFGLSGLHAKKTTGSSGGTGGGSARKRTPPAGQTGAAMRAQTNRATAKKARPATAAAKKAAAKKAAAKKAAAKKAAASGTKPPRNSKLAGSNHPKTNVPFDSNGYPDFSQWRHPTVSDVTIQLANPPSRSKDFAAANKAAGLSSTPPGYTWHHHQTKGLMQLIETGVHGKTGHTGGFSG